MLPSCRNKDSVIERPEDCLQFIRDTFGFPVDVFKDFVVLRANRKRFHVYPRHLELDYLLPDANISAVGISFARARMVHPKMTTAAARMFGKFATKNFLELDLNELETYFKREGFVCSRNRVCQLSATGQLLVRFAGQGIGIAAVRELEGDLIDVQSLYPKGWSRSVGVGAVNEPME